MENFYKKFSTNSKPSLTKFYFATSHGCVYMLGEMRYLALATITITATLLTPMVSGASEMYENLRYGDTKDTVQKKLDKVLGNAKGQKTIFGRTGMNGMYTAKAKVNGLEFSLYFGWDSSKGKLALNAVDLYSNEASMEKIGKAYKQLSTLFTELYGKPKFNNGLPSKSKLTSPDMTIAGACWFYDTDAIMLSLGRTENGINLVVNFTDKQPQLIRTP